MGEERKPFWPWIVALLIGLPALYVVSFGPACWVCSRLDPRNQERWCRLERGYKPIIWLACRNHRMNDAATWYAELLAEETVRLWRRGDGRCRIYGRNVSSN